MESLEVIHILFPMIIMYNVWMHNRIIKNTQDIAVNTSKDEALTDSVKEFKAEIKEITKIIHRIASKLDVDI